MKKILISALFFAYFTETKACADYYPDGDYFNLFTQTIIKDKSYIPFLLAYDAQFYDDGVKRMIPDQNIFAWKKYFGEKLDYRETEFVVNHMQMNDLNNFKKGNLSNSILKKLGSYGNFKDGIDYLIEAKYLEPFMRINYVESEDSFYYRENDTAKNATQLDYQKTINALVSLYNAAKNPEIKQRYGYQLVRFDHYNRNFERAVANFKKYVESINLRTAPYFLALDQMAGAQRGLEQYDNANWNFFQAFKNLNNRKESIYTSMKISDSTSFKNILNRAKTPEEKNMAYFLLGYLDFNNPLPTMEKMYEIDPNSEILKVMAARSINQLERSYLPTLYHHFDENGNQIPTNSKQENTVEVKKKEQEKPSFWDRIVRFFKNLFSSDKKENSDGEKNSASDKELLENPNRIPIYTNNAMWYGSDESKDYLNDFSKFTEKTKEKSTDEFWHIADAYLKFLQKDFETSNEILNEIKTTNPEYQQQISRMKMLNEITAQPKIDADFENKIMKDFPDLFAENKKNDSLKTNYDYYYELPSTADFIKDVLANRYFLQGEDGKSFLMNNQLSDLQYNPNADLAKQVQNFINKKDKTELEQKIIMKNVDVADANSFFNIIYGDQEMRNGNFEKAKQHYAQSTNFAGIPRLTWVYNEEKETSSQKPVTFEPNQYNGFKNISSLIFAHNRWESFQSSPNKSMIAENFIGEFPFIKNNMNKLELAEAVIQLKKIGNKKGMEGAKANQLIGNVLYNTSMLGYFREVFSMDINNYGWQKNSFYNETTAKPTFYYKNYSWETALKPDNFDVALNFYNKALQQTSDKEQKARILFQMASAEQGKYYQWEAKQENHLEYDDPKWEEKRNAFQEKLDATKNQKYRTYFSLLKKEYSDTSVAQSLMGSCSYYGYFVGR